MIDYLNKNKLECIQFLQGKKEFRFYLNLIVENVKTTEDFKIVSEILYQYQQYNLSTTGYKIFFK